MSTWFAVILAGGSGTRFWPVSRSRRPKQFLPIGVDRPLLVETSARLQPLIPPERQMVVTGRPHLELVRELLAEIPPGQVVGEPAVRDTAPCIGMASRLVECIDPAATVLMIPSDQVVGDVDVFHAVLRSAEAALAAMPERVLVFGVEPNRPATGYGYLRRGAEAGLHAGRMVYDLDAFVEKPDAGRAEQMLAEGGHTWNAGMFAFRPATLNGLVARLLPAMDGPLRRIASAFGRDEFDAILTREFPPLRKISIDYGIMEKLSDGLLLPMPVPWDDVGSWAALERLATPDETGNIHQGETLALDARGNVLSARDGLVVAAGVNDLIVVHTPDATLVCRKDDAEGVKRIVQALREAGLERYL